MGGEGDSILQGNPCTAMTGLHLSVFFHSLTLSDLFSHLYFFFSCHFHLFHRGSVQHFLDRLCPKWKHTPTNTSKVEASCLNRNIFKKRLSAGLRKKRMQGLWVLSSRRGLKRTDELLIKSRKSCKTNDIPIRFGANWHSRKESMYFLSWLLKCCNLSSFSSIFWSALSSHDCTALSSLSPHRGPQRVHCPLWCPPLPFLSNQIASMRKCQQIIASIHIWWPMNSLYGVQCMRRRVGLRLSRVEG